MTLPGLKDFVDNLHILSALAFLGAETTDRFEPCARSHYLLTVKEALMNLNKLTGSRPLKASGTRLMSLVPWK